MNYIPGPLPKDTDEIWPGYTWRTHRAMEKLLAELDDEDPAIQVHSDRIRTSMEEFGLTDIEPPKWCEFCHQFEGQPHDLECRDSNDPSLWVRREARAYCYLDEKFEEVHTTSTPMTDEEAVEYFTLVHTWFPNDPPKYITRKGLDKSDDKFHMMPFMYEAEYRAVIRIVTS